MGEGEGTLISIGSSIEEPMLFFIRFDILIDSIGIVALLLPLVMKDTHYSFSSFCLDFFECLQPYGTVIQFLKSPLDTKYTYNVYYNEGDVFLEMFSSDYLIFSGHLSNFIGYDL
jgi:hypothetical protein